MMIRQDPHIFSCCQPLLFQCLKVAPSFCSYYSSPLPLSESLSSFPWNYLRNIKLKHETFNFKAWSFSPNILSYLASMILIVSGTECSCLGRAPRSLVTSEDTRHCKNGQELTTTNLLRTTHQICSPEWTSSLCCHWPPSWLVPSQGPDQGQSGCPWSSPWSPPLCHTASAETLRWCWWTGWA